MASDLPTLEDISVVKCAILLSLSRELKPEILCVPRSEYDACKLRYQYYRKEQWNDIVERKAKEILNNRQLPIKLQIKVLSIIPAIGLRMLIWAEYHEGTLGLTRYYSLNFLRHTHFTFQGLIDNKKAAEDMIKDVTLSIMQQYKLACMYCFKNHIFTFFKHMVEYEKIFNSSPDRLTKWMQKPEIVKYWTLHLTGRVDEDSNNTPRHLYMLEKSIKSGCIEAVKYSLEITDVSSRESALIYGVTELVSNIYNQTDWIVFRDERFDDSKESWVPNYFYLDILCFLLSNMTEAQQKKALEKNLNSYLTDDNEYIKITVLEMLLIWPYQEYFMKTARLVWELIPEDIYPHILFEICENIESIKSFNLFLGEERSYDYKKLLKNFWNESPDRFKRFVFADKQIDYWDGAEVTIRPLGTNLLFHLISLKTFTYDDEKNIKLLLSSATLEEKSNLLSIKWWRPVISKLLELEKQEIVTRLMVVFFQSAEEAEEFKRKINLSDIALNSCKYFLKCSKINAIKSLMQWMSLSNRELISLKKDIIFSSCGMQYCRQLLSTGKNKDFEDCVNWFLPSKDKVIEYKRALALNIKENSHTDCFPVHKIGEKDILDFITRFTRSKLPSGLAIKGIQTSVGDIFGRTICEELIAGSSFQVIYDEQNSLLQVKKEFTGGQWERVNEFLHWSLSSENKILQFKRNIFQVSGVNIHFQLIKAKQWEEARKFFLWLRLSANEIKDLKKRTLYHDPCREMLRFLVFDHDNMNNFETVEAFLKWNLTDKISVIEFRNVFLKGHENFHESFHEFRAKKFNAVIENYLDELDREEHYPTNWNQEQTFLLKLATTSKRKSTEKKFVKKKPQKKIRLSSVKKQIHNENTGNSGRRRSQRLMNKAKKL